MFNTLRKRFILISMLSVILVLGIIIAGINILNYDSTVRNADAILGMLAGNEGRFPERGGEVPPPPGQETDAPDRSPELRFESRYFSVLLDAEGGVLETDTGMIVAVQSEEANTMAADVFAQDKTKGFVNDYRFLKVSEGADTRIIFYDCGRSMDSFRSFLKASLLISAIGAAVVFALIFIASGKIMRPVAESYEKQKRFITDAGHEIKTPLAIINADADVILSEEQNSWAEDIKDQVSRMTELTNNLIFLSKMEEGIPEMNMTDTDLTAVVTKSCNSFDSRYITDKKTLVKRIEDGVTVKGEEKSLQEIMSILLDNALKYSPEGGTTLVELQRSPKGVRLTVTNDTSYTVDKESAGHLLDRFYRTDNSRRSVTVGHCIGLSIAKAIAQAHKARITADVKEDGKLAVKIIFTEG